MMLVCHIGVPVQVPAALLPVQLSASVSGKAEEGGPSIWDPAPREGEPDGAPGSGL